MLDVTNKKGFTMSTTPWGTMNGWLRFETEQQGRWRRQRVQDLRAAQVTGLPAVAPVRPAAKASPRPAGQAPTRPAKAVPRPAVTGGPCTEAA